MGIKEFFSGDSPKGVDCQDDENGNKICRVMIKDKNSKLSTGSEFQLHIDPQTCKATTFGRYSVFDDDQDVVQKTLKKAESDCRGGIN